MKILKITCRKCGGLGTLVVYKPLVNSNTAERVETVCDECNGKRHIETATFSPEEAAEILKHCGLPVPTEISESTGE